MPVYRRMSARKRATPAPATPPEETATRRLPETQEMAFGVETGEF